MTKFVFITGGVVSSLGKGLGAAALGALLQARGHTVRIRKLDPYLNVDPGTMSPLEHGECFVTDDGAETDLDLGHYERFLDVSATQSDNVTTGRIYSSVISRERQGGYLGKTVQVIPHITNEIKTFITADLHGEDFVLCEIGGTVGDIESTPFLEAIRQLRTDLGRENTAYLHVTLLPYISVAGELKTKPTQHSVKELLGLGIQPDVLLCRADFPIPESEREKIALFCNVRKERVIPALNVDTIYDVPRAYFEQGLDTQILEYFNMDVSLDVDLSKWDTVVKTVRNPKRQVKIGVIGKYVSLPDAYKSLSEALVHGGIANDAKVDADWIDSGTLENTENVSGILGAYDGLLVPGGFGCRGVEGKINAITYARDTGTPFLGICMGMQMAVIESARRAGIHDAGSSEWEGFDGTDVIGLMTAWVKGNTTHSRDENTGKGGTLRLGAYPCDIAKNSNAYIAYGTARIHERHRHRYEVNYAYADILARVGLVFTGMSPCGTLPEIAEVPDHPWFVSVQYHPELKSRPFKPHPLFVDFIKATKYK